MKLGVRLDVEALARGRAQETIAEAVALEDVGVDFVWVPEAYGPDAVSIAATILARTTTLCVGSAILSIFARTPALLGQTAATLDLLSNGRFILGIGVSGSKVVEGWHGVAFEDPLKRTREVVEICRKVWRREALQNEGAYPIPLITERTVGAGKPLKIVSLGHRPDIPIFIAALGPKNVELTAECAEGWLPTFYVPEFARTVWGDALRRGRERRPKSLGSLEVVAGGPIAIGEDVEHLLDDRRPYTALHIGGYGPRGRNFYNDLVQRYGYERDAIRIQDLYLDGKKEEAERAIPKALLNQLSLIGPKGFVEQRIAAYEESGVTILNVVPLGQDRLTTMEQVRSMVS